MERNLEGKVIDIIPGAKDGNIILDQTIIIVLTNGRIIGLFNSHSPLFPNSNIGQLIKFNIAVLSLGQIIHKKEKYILSLEEMKTSKRNYDLSTISRDALLFHGETCGKFVYKQNASESSRKWGGKNLYYIDCGVGTVMWNTNAEYNVGDYVCFECRFDYFGHE